MGESFSEVAAREAKSFLPVVGRMPVALVSGEGSRVRDVDGREFIDLTAGWGVNAIGHCHPRLVEALSRQASALMQTTNLFYSVPQLDLCDHILRVCPDAMTRCMFMSSGAEAMEGAVKLSHRATGGRSVYVSTTQSFHGRTLGALRLIGQAKHREPYAALLPPARVVPFGDTEAALAAIDENVAAFVVEPVQGEGGVHPAPPGYLQAIRERCDATGALLVLDEIQTGLGRTGRWLALEHDGVIPDILTLGKGLGGGVPISAFVCSEAVAETVNLGDHGGTYAGNLLMCAAANAVFETIIEENLISRSETLGETLMEHLRSFATAHPGVVTEVRGRGLLVGLELADAERAAALPKQGLENGVLVNVTAGNVVRFFPALNIPEEELFRAVDTLLGLITA